MTWATICGIVALALAGVLFVAVCAFAILCEIGTCGEGGEEES